MKDWLSIPFFKAEVTTTSATTVMNRDTSQKSVPRRRLSRRTAITTTVTCTSPTSASSNGSTCWAKLPLKIMWHPSIKQNTSPIGAANASVTCQDTTRSIVPSMKDAESAGYVVQLDSSRLINV